jgi:hypothetical protein
MQGPELLLAPAHQGAKKMNALHHATSSCHRDPRWVITTQTLSGPRASVNGTFVLSIRRDDVPVISRTYYPCTEGFLANRVTVECSVENGG